MSKAQDTLWGVIVAFILSAMMLALSGCTTRFPIGELGSIVIGYEPNLERFSDSAWFGGTINPPTLRDK